MVSFLVGQEEGVAGGQGGRGLGPLSHFLPPVYTSGPREGLGRA